MPGVNFLENQNETATTALVAKRLRIQLKVAPRSQLRSGEFNQSAQLTQITASFSADANDVGQPSRFATAPIKRIGPTREFSDRRRRRRRKRRWSARRRYHAAVGAALEHEISLHHPISLHHRLHPRDQESPEAILPERPRFHPGVPRRPFDDLRA